jgi:acetyl-CoA synthetase
MEGFSDQIAWKPSKDRIAKANITRFMQQLGTSTYAEMIEKTSANPGWYTENFLKFLDIRFRKPYETILDLSDGIEWPHWCVNGEMNIIDNCLDRHIGTETAKQAALIWESEDGKTTQISYNELILEVNKTANALRQLGLGKGDAIGIYMPMIPEVVIAFLAIAKIGAVLLPLFSGYGTSAVANRLVDAEAHALFTADGFYHGGNLVPLKDTADKALDGLNQVQHVIVTRYGQNEIKMEPGRDHWWEELIPEQSHEAETQNTLADDLIMLIYTSGTTGRPKGTMHTHCGFPIKVTMDMAFNQDVHPSDIVYWITDMGWMMGPWLVFGTLLLGATMFIYDGSPMFPHPGRVWEMVERHKINMLGLSPTYVRAIRVHGNEPVNKYDITSLKTMSSTGEPWTPGAWQWLFEQVGKSQIPIINYTGGTEIGGGILMDSPVLPIRPASFASSCPGISADVFGEDGNPVRNSVGELVVKAPWIGMTRGFWKDKQRYLDTYWGRWPGAWVQGDWAHLTDDGTWYVLGRSDDTIKVAGKRLGPAEVEAALDGHPSVAESAAIGVPDQIKGSAVVCFVVLNPDFDSSVELTSSLRDRVIDRLGKPLAPREINFITQIPKTRNGKVMRRMVRSAYLDRDPGDTSALVNPEALNEIREISDRR